GAGPDGRRSRTNSMPPTRALGPRHDERPGRSCTGAEPRRSIHLPAVTTQSTCAGRPDSPGLRPPCAKHGGSRRSLALPRVRAPRCAAKSLPLAMITVTIQTMAESRPEPQKPVHVLKLHLDRVLTALHRGAAAERDGARPTGWSLAPFRS